MAKKTALHPQHDFFRTPHWRWDRAGRLLVTGRRLDRRVDDDWVAAARQAHSRPTSEMKDGVVRSAHDIWQGDPAVRHELEAWLLTDEPLTEVAKRLRLSAEVVAAYEALFFAVREVKTATDWLLLRAVGYSALQGVTGPMPYAAWKLAALHGGPLALEVVTAATSGHPLPVGVLRAGQNRAVPEARLRLKVKLWIALLAADTPSEFERVIYTLCQLREQQAADTGEAVSVTPGLLAAESVLLSLPALTRRPKATTDPHSPTPQRRRRKR